MGNGEWFGKPNRYLNLCKCPRRHLNTTIPLLEHPNTTIPLLRCLVVSCWWAHQMPGEAVVSCPSGQLWQDECTYIHGSLHTRGKRGSGQLPCSPDVSHKISSAWRHFRGQTWPRMQQPLTITCSLSSRKPQFQKTLWAVGPAMDLAPWLQANTNPARRRTNRMFKGKLNAVFAPILINTTYKC